MLVNILLIISQALADELVYVIEVCRHGARTPYLYQPWDTAEVWGSLQAGELTPFGMRQHYLIGQQLRQELITDEKLLSENFNVNEVRIFSTDFGRTLVSAQSQLLGLYPSGTGPDLRDPSLKDIAVPPITVANLENLKTQLGNHAVLNQDAVIPIYTNSAQYQYELDPQSVDCPRLKQLTSANAQSQYIQDLYTTYSDTVKVIQDYFSITFDEAKDKVMVVNDSIVSNLFQGNQIPTQFTQDFQYKVKQLSWLVENYMSFNTDELIKLFSSNLLTDISNQLNYASKGLMNNKFMLFSAHDTTVKPVLFGLGLSSKYTWPEYASTIFFKLYKDSNGAFYVKTLYNGRLVVLPTCNNVNCPLDTFTKYVGTRVFPDFNQACQAKTEEVEVVNVLTEEEVYKLDAWKIVVSCIVTVLVSLAIGYTAYIAYRKLLNPPERRQNILLAS